MVNFFKGLPILQTKYRFGFILDSQILEVDDSRQRISDTEKTCDQLRLAYTHLVDELKSLLVTNREKFDYIYQSLISSRPEDNSEDEQKIRDLMKAVDEYIPTPEHDLTKPFLMPVEDVFTITGRGTVATGRVERGTVKVGDAAEIVGLQDEPTQTVITGVEMFRKTLDQAMAGDNIGALLRGIDRTDIERGQVLAKPGTVHPHTEFTAQVYVLTKDEGGRHTPFFNGYRPQFFFRTTDVTGDINLPEGVEMCMPGDNIEMSVKLITPIAMEEGQRFAIREGGRTVGAGVVAKITK